MTNKDLSSNRFKESQENHKKNMRKITFFGVIFVLSIVYLYFVGSLNLISFLLLLMFLSALYYKPFLFVILFIAIYSIYLPIWILKEYHIYVNTELLHNLLIIYSFILVFVQLFSSNKDMLKRYNDVDRNAFYLFLIFISLTFIFTTKFSREEIETIPFGFTEISKESINSYIILYGLLGIIAVLFADTLEKIEDIVRERRGKVPGKMKKNH